MTIISYIINLIKNEERLSKLEQTFEEMQKSMKAHTDEEDEVHKYLVDGSNIVKDLLKNLK